MVRFVKWSFCLGYKTDFEEDIIELDFLQKSALKNIVSYLDYEKSQRGIQISKKQEIKLLCHTCKIIEDNFGKTYQSQRML